jgi:NAD(P)-dependent dehydrogenase (short-subunit alcohol dehydrogenase family)
MGGAEGKLAGKVVLVTGAASGIGLATVRRIEADGGVAIGADITRGYGSAVDVRDDAAVGALIDGIVADHGRIDGVVTAAGVAGGGPVHLIDEDEFNRVIGVNLTGSPWTASAVHWSPSPASKASKAPPAGRRTTRRRVGSCS